MDTLYNREARSFEPAGQINRRTDYGNSALPGNNALLQARELEQAAQKFRAQMTENAGGQAMDNVAVSQLQRIGNEGDGSRLNQASGNQSLERTVQTDHSGRTIERLVRMDTSGQASNNVTQVSDRVISDNKAQESAGPEGDKGLEKAGKGEKSADKDSSRQMDNEIDSLIGMIENIIAKLGNSDATKGLKADLEKVLVELKSVKGDSVPIDKKSSVMTQAQATIAKLM